MGELEIKLASGGTAVVKGTPAEIAEVLRLAGLNTSEDTVNNPGTPARRGVPAKRGAKEKAAPKKSTRFRKIGPRGRVEELVGDGYFKTKRSLADVRDQLKQGGHLYKATDLSPVLIRLVRDKQLRRTKGESGHWAYGD